MSRIVTAAGPRSANSRSASSRILARAVLSSGGGECMFTIVNICLVAKTRRPPPVVAEGVSAADRGFGAVFGFRQPFAVMAAMGADFVDEARDAEAGGAQRH